MEVFRNPNLFIRQFNALYAVVLPTAALLGGHGLRAFTGPAIQVGPQEIGEFAFDNGILLPHQEYLYGSAETGEPYIVGKKLLGGDYSAWEAGYENFARPESATLAGSNSKSTYSWSLGAPKASASFNISQLLLWITFGIVCALLLHYLLRKIVCRVSRKKTLPNPTGDIDVEHSMLNHLWRRLLISMYLERKSEILSLSKLAVHYYESSNDLEGLIANEKKKKREAKSELERLKAEHADQLVEKQKEMDRLRQELEATKCATKDLEEQVVALQSDKKVATTTIQDLEEQIRALRSEKPAESEDAEEPLREGQSDAAIAGDQDPDVEHPAESSEGEHSKAGAMGEEEEEGDSESATRQDDDSPAPEEEGTGPGVDENERPRKVRVNRRRDGTVRTASHPDYVPPSGRGNLGNRGRGRGNGWQNGRGGRGSDGGGRFGFRGWTGGRGGRGQ